ncbi:MAG: CPBP family intramembrane metalloprotease [Flavobacteriales bacterium]|nr:CPBP family intramembrane metalloprotease [Flavobacteriales bacterium]
MPRVNIKALALFTLIAFPIFAIVLMHFFSDDAFLIIFENKRSLVLQIATGVLFGAASAMLAIQLVRIPFMENSTSKYTKMLQKLNLSIPMIIFISFAAGIGEEILFRGAIQNILGLWPAAIIFVAIHGYLNPMDWKISVYGVFLVFVSAAFGYLFNNQGIYSPILAHTVFDLILLFYVKNNILHTTEHYHDEEE